MKIHDLTTLSKDEVYDLATSGESNKKITNDSPYEEDSRTFPAGARAYSYTNEGLCALRDIFNLDLSGRNVLGISASGDPIGVFSVLGAGTQVGFDTSHRAILYGEVKLDALRTLDFKGFRSLMGLTEEADEAREKELYDSLSEGLSNYARSIFDELVESTGSMRGLINDAKMKFFRHFGCSAAYPQFNIFSQNEEDYLRAQENLRANSTVLIPGSLEDVLRLVGSELNPPRKSYDEKVNPLRSKAECTQSERDGFSVFYGSNILDHIRAPDGTFDYLEETMRSILNKFDNILTGDKRTLILQFEWMPEEPKKVVFGIMKELGYDARDGKELANSKGVEYPSAYGSLCVGEKG